MTNRRSFLFNSVSAAGAGLSAALLGGAAFAKPQTTFEVMHTEAEWRQILSPQAYVVMRQEGTERPGSSPLDKEKRKGAYNCAGCDLPLFASSTKYHSGTGWPSFWRPLPNAVATRTDTSFFMDRTEVHCRRCGGHLGHVFNDGPPPTGKRYCMDGVALKFIREKTS